MQFFKICLFLLIGMVLSNAKGQNIGEWRVYSSFSTVNSISVSGDGNAYVSTLGGLFTVENGEITNTFTTIDGLHRLDILESAIDESTNQVFLGYTDGMMNVFDIDTKTFQSIEDINRVDQFTSKQINDIEILGKEVYVATDFGIVVLNATNLLVLNSYLTIGQFNRGSAVLDIEIEGDSIYVGTEFGFGSASLFDNLLDANAWYSLATFTEDVPVAVNQVVTMDGNVLVVKNDSLLRFRNGSLLQVDGIDSDGVIGVDRTSENIVVAYDSEIILLGSELVSTNFFQDSDISIRSIEATDDRLYLGTSQEGILVIDMESSNMESYLPTGPFLNFFGNLSVRNQTLLSSSSIEFPSSDPFNSIRGYYVFDDEWQSYNALTNEVMDAFNYGLAYTNYITSSDYYIGSWGAGVLRHNIETDEITIFDASNTGLTGIEANRNYIVIGGIFADSNDNIWATSFQSDVPLNVYSPSNDEWFHFPKEAISSGDLYYRLFIDSNDQKWISLIDFDTNGRGLLVIDTGSDFEDSSDDTFRKLTSDETNGNLPDENVTAIIEDKNGEVWIGTKRGIARFIFPDFIVESNSSSEINAQWLINEDTSATSRFLLRDVNVTALAVNEANQKWIGSENQGLWLLNEEGSRIEKRFTSENSSLISDNILSIAIDDVTGEVFIATDLGLVSYVDVATTPVNSMDKLKVYPNPFVYEKHDQIFVENLSEATDIKVLGVDGTVVHEFETQGGRATWDGLDYVGNQLGSGVYFLVALSDDGGQKGIGKVVIIR